MLVLAALLLVNFLLFALTRRLNFDESLALHAGWLSFNEVPAQPFFYMPFSLVLGWLATLIEDPGRLFVTLRLTAVLSLLLVLLLLVWRLGLKGRTTLFAVLLLFANGGFLSHGYEFRYDLAVLLGWLLGFVALQERSRAGLILLGLCIGWLAIHHLKGVYFAGWLYLFGLLRLQLDRGLRPGSLLPYHLALLLPALLWAGYSLLSGRSGELIGFYSGFISLSLEAQKVWPWESMLRRLVLDGPWWWLVLPASIGALLMRRERWLRWAAGFVLVGGLFPFVHPHPWAYMVVPLLPFAALLAAAGLEAVVERTGLVAWQQTMVLSLLLVALGAGPYFATFWGLRQVPMERQVASLRLLKEVLRPDDRIIDPSGLTYFVRPALAFWYSDSLFRQRYQEAVASVVDLKGADAASLALQTYRLQWLPAELRQRLGLDTARFCGGVIFLQQDERERRISEACELRQDRLESFW